MSSIKKYYYSYLFVKMILIKMFKHLSMFKSSVFFQMGISSNNHYYDPKLKSPMVMPLLWGFMPMPIFWVNLLSLYIMWKSQVVYYYIKYQFWKDFKKFMYDLLQLWFAFTFGVLIIYFAFNAARIWYMFHIFFEKIFNIVSWKSDWTIISWFQWFIFYSYFDNMSFYFYFKMYWPDLSSFLAGMMAFIHEDFLLEPEFGPDTRYFGWSNHPWFKSSFLNNSVLVCKKLLYFSKLEYYYFSSAFYKKHKFFWKQNFKSYMKKKCGF